MLWNLKLPRGSYVYGLCWTGTMLPMEFGEAAVPVHALSIQQQAQQPGSNIGMQAQEHKAARRGSLQPLKHLSNLKVSPAQVVTICVGGTVFSTMLSTLTAVPSSYLAILFGDSDWQPSSILPGSQTPFIDRDGDLFRYVLAYLRTVRDCDHHQLLMLPESPVQLQQLKAEADFYGLPGLATICSLGRSGAQLSGVWGRFAALQQHQHQQHRPAGKLQEQHQAQAQQQLQHGELTPRINHVPVSASEVEVDLPAQQETGRMTLAAAMLQAQLISSNQQQLWSQDTALQEYADIVMRHLVQLPLAAQQPDLVAALANAGAGSKLELRFAYYPVGDVRIDIQCRVIPANADQAAAIAAAAAGAGAGAARASSPSPSASPRDTRQQQPPVHQQQQYRRNTISNGEAVLSHSGDGGQGNGSGRTYSGPLPPEAAGVAAVAAAAAAAAAVNSYAGAAVMPGPGWGGVTMYHRYTIKETSDKFVLTTHSPGEAQEVQEMPHAAFKLQLKKYSGLHKLCVQQCPRGSVAGLVWLLEQAGFSTVQLSTDLETYFVGRNTFTSFVSVLTCSL